MTVTKPSHGDDGGVSEKHRNCQSLTTNQIITWYLTCL